MVNVEDLRELLDAQHEWLLVREIGAAFPIEPHLIEITSEDNKTLFGFLDDNGFHTWRLNEFSLERNEIVIDASNSFGKTHETMRLIPRTPAKELTAEVERARIEKANEIASFVKAHFEDCKLGRVALNVESGRLAQIEFLDQDKVPMAAIADVTGKLTVEVTYTAAILWLDKLGLRKKQPVNDIYVICEKRAAKNAQKLHALLDDRWKAKITILEIDRKPETPRLIELPKRNIRDLWRQRSRRFKLPETTSSETAQRVVELSPEDIDVIYSRSGETLRFRGLPFARVRTIMGKETAWFGIGREQKMLEENFDELETLIEQLKLHRSPDAENKRHTFYRTASEAWLESILRRNIKLLDANLILSPIYNQFRSSNDKIDLLALRRDGRLVIVELKTQPDREMIFQAADYWRKIELQRRRGDLAAANLFDGREILDKPTLIYLAAPAWSFHRDYEFFAKTLSPDIELWRFELHEDWRRDIKVITRLNYVDATYR